MKKLNTIEITGVILFILFILYLAFFVSIVFIALLSVFVLTKLFPAILVSISSPFKKKAYTDYNPTWEELVKKRSAHHIHLYKYVHHGDLVYGDSKPVKDIYGHYWKFSDKSKLYTYLGGKGVLIN